MLKSWITGGILAFGLVSGGVVTADVVGDEIAISSEIDSLEGEDGSVEHPGGPRPGGRGRRGSLIRAIMSEVETQTELDRCEILEAVANEQTLEEIITSADGNVDDIQSALLEKLEDRLNEAVAEGKIDSERAETLLDEAPDKLNEMFTTPAPNLERAQNAYERVCGSDN